MKATDFPLAQYRNISYRNVAGHRFGKLLVISREIKEYRNDGRHRHWWKCLCDCGNFYYTEIDGLIRAHTMSCGCIGFRARICPAFKAIVIDHRINTEKSASQIGAYFGISKNSVIGILDRAGMCTSKNEISPVARREPITFPPLNQCVYPNGTPGEVGFTWCCQPVKTDSSFCPEHHAICYIREDGPKKESSINTMDMSQQRLGSKVV